MGGPADDVAALADLWNAAGGEGWEGGASWLPLDDPPCRVGSSASPRAGVECDERSGRVASVDLDGRGARGTVPDSVGRLEGLRRLNVRHNAGLSGTLPRALEGLAKLEEVLLSATAISGGWPNSSPEGGFPALTLIEADNSQLGGSMGGMTHISTLRSLRLYNAQISGTIPDALWPDIRFVYVGKNPRLGGPVPRALAYAWALVAFAAEKTGVSGPLPLDWSRCSDKLFFLDLSNSGLDGAVPASMFESCAGLSQVYLTGCAALDASLPALASPSSLISYDASFTGATSLPPDVPSTALYTNLANLHIHTSRLTGLLHESGLCRLSRLVVLAASENELSGTFPLCLARLPRVSEVLLELNNIAGVEAFALSSASSLATLGLAGNLLSLDALRAGAAPPPAPDGADEAPKSTIQRLGLSANALNAPLNETLAAVLPGLPALSELTLKVTGASGLLERSVLYDPETRTGDGLGSASLRDLDLSDNPGISGFVPEYMREVFPGLHRIDLSDTSVTGHLPLGMSVAHLDFHQSGISSCLPQDLLSSSALLSVTGQGTPPADADCVEEMRALIRLDVTDRFVGGTNGTLQCSRWRTLASSALLSFDPLFMDRLGCECLEPSYWSDRDERCVACPPADGPLLCRPEVHDAPHCMSGSFYPMLDGRLVTERRLLPFASFLPCRDGSVCNARFPTRASCLAGAAAAAAGVTDDPGPAGGFNASTGFECASGFDAKSLLCSRCEEGRYEAGGRCFECVGAFSWLAPLTLLLAAYALFAYLLGKRRHSGTRTLSIAVFFFQLLGVLDQSYRLSSQVGSSADGGTGDGGGTGGGEAGQGEGAQGGGAGGGAAVEWVMGACESVVRFRPWAPECLDERFDFVAETTWTLALPFVVLGGGAAAWLVLRVLRPPRWRDWSRRAVFAACFLLDSLFLVVWERSLASFKCTSVDGGGVRLRYLTAAPYVDCDGPELVRVRVLAGFALAAFGLGLPLALAVAAWRRRAAARAAVAPTSHPLDFVLASARPAVFWWPIAVDYPRKVVLAAMSTTLPFDSVLVPILMFGALLLTLLLHVAFRPWRFAADNALESLVLVSALAQYLIDVVSASPVYAAGDVDTASAVVRAVTLAVIAALLARHYARVARRWWTRKAGAGADGAGHNAGAAAAQEEKEEEEDAGREEMVPPAVVFPPPRMSRGSEARVPLLQMGDADNL